MTGSCPTCGFSWDIICRLSTSEDTPESRKQHADVCQTDPSKLPFLVDDGHEQLVTTNEPDEAGKPNDTRSSITNTVPEVQGTQTSSTANGNAGNSSEKQDRSTGSADINPDEPESPASPSSTTREDIDKTSAEQAKRKRENSDLGEESSDASSSEADSGDTGAQTGQETDSIPTSSSAAQSIAGAAPASSTSGATPAARITSEASQKFRRNFTDIAPQWAPVYVDDVLGYRGTKSIPAPVQTVIDQVKAKMRANNRDPDPPSNAIPEPPTDACKVSQEFQKALGYLILNSDIYEFYGDTRLWTMDQWKKWGTHRTNSRNPVIDSNNKKRIEVQSWGRSNEAFLRGQDIAEKGNDSRFQQWKASNP